MVQFSEDEDKGRSTAFQGRTTTFQARTLTFQGRTLTFQGRTLTFQGRTLTFQGRTLTFQGRTLTFQGRTLTLQGRTLTFHGRTLRRSPSAWRRPLRCCVRWSSEAADRRLCSSPRMSAEGRPGGRRPEPCGPLWPPRSRREALRARGSRSISLRGTASAAAGCSRNRVSASPAA